MVFLIRIDVGQTRGVRSNNTNVIFDRGGARYSVHTCKIRSFSVQIHDITRKVSRFVRPLLCVWDMDMRFFGSEPPRVDNRVTTAVCAAPISISRPSVRTATTRFFYIRSRFHDFLETGTRGRRARKQTCRARTLRHARPHWQCPIKFTKRKSQLA